MLTIKPLHGKAPSWTIFISTLKTISKINHLSLKDEQTTSQSKLIPDPESIKITSSNPELASILKSDPKPMVPNQYKRF